ncbi:hypothetical protein BD324DRAFT_635372 [Kockovaella imperatae]|uniref:Uncharacterized protein n=1 Tax=Kockovaella imperatae TaxID=4999 RepID=A0A1Y1U9Z6_9TREE|nr:hypothetical protein BD324DRAFT_635372 [Kockovaella imperatae]ORX34860.1 hypothetical protein BD324DRAFT_635372 [Kockovaella imperatae]
MRLPNFTLLAVLAAITQEASAWPAQRNKRDEATTTTTETDHITQVSLADRCSSSQISPAPNMSKIILAHVATDRLRHPYPDRYRNGLCD